MNKEEALKELDDCVGRIGELNAYLQATKADEPETAFQGMARKYLDATYPARNILEMSWDEVISIYGRHIPPLLVFFSATLDLAIGATDDGEGACCCCVGNIEAIKVISCNRKQTGY